jgi:hypothetical protein
MSVLCHKQTLATLIRSYRRREQLVIGDTWSDFFTPPAHDQAPTSFEEV